MVPAEPKRAIFHVVDITKLAFFLIDSRSSALKIQTDKFIVVMNASIQKYGSCFCFFNVWFP
jgi:hypothetical protein